MSDNLFTGRIVQRRFIRDYLLKILEENKDSRFRFRKQRENEEVFPRIMLFHGENGYGKSSMVRHCVDVAQRLSEELKKPLTIISLDWDEWNSRNGSFPITQQNLVDALYDACTNPAVEAHEFFSGYESQKSKIQEIKDSIESIRNEEWIRHKNLNDPSAPPSGTGSGEINTAIKQEEDIFLAWLIEQGKISPKDANLYTNGINELVQILTNGLTELSNRNPIMLVFDALEAITTPSLEKWFRTDILSPLFDQRCNILSVLSGNIETLRQFRNDFPEELVFPMHFDYLSLTRNDISLLASKRNLRLQDNEIGLIEERSWGIPLVVVDLLDYLQKGYPLENLLEDTLPPNEENWIHGLIGRFFQYCEDGNAITKMCNIAMVHHFNTDLLAHLWNISSPDIQRAINEYAKHFSFFDHNHIHRSIYHELRGYLIQEAGHGSESKFFDLFNHFTSVATEYYEEQIGQLGATIADRKALYSDERYRQAVIGYFNCLLWSDSDKAFGMLPGIYLECLHYGSNLITDVIDLLSEFVPVLPETHQQTLSVLQSGLISNREGLFWYHIRPFQEEFGLLQYLSGCGQLLSTYQKALLHCKRGDIRYRSEDYDEALREFDKSREYFDQEGISAADLFGRYAAVGSVFSGRGDFERAKHALVNATSLNPGKFQPWFDLGYIEVTLEQHEEAVYAFSEAVTIHAGSQEAWMYLGLSYSALEQYENAAQAFTHASETGPEQLEIWFEMGQALLALDNYADAMQAFKRVVALDPKNAEAWYAIGKSGTGIGDAVEAISAYRKAVEIKPTFKEAWKSLASELFLQGTFEESAEAYEQATALEPNEYPLWNKLGLAYFGAGLFEKSIESCTKAIDLEPSDDEAWNNIGHCYGALGQVGKALEFYSKAAELNPDNADTWNNIGNGLYSQGQYNDAIVAYTNAAQLNPNSDNAWYNIGLAYQIQENNAEAVNAYAQAIAIDNQNMETWYHKGCAHASLLQHTEAIDCFDHVVQINEEADDAWFRRGMAYAILGNHEEAIESYNKALQLRSSDPEILFYIGVSYNALGRESEAIGVLSESVAASPEQPEAWYQLGHAYQEQKNYADAVEAYRKSLELQNFKLDVWYNLGLSCYNLGRFDEAHQALNEALKMGGDQNNDIIYHAALANHALENYAEAVHFYQIVTRNNPELLDAWSNMGLALHAQGKYRDAVKIYKRIIEDWPDNDATWYNMGLAYHAEGRFDDAVKVYRTASKLNPESAETWYHLGIAFHARESYGDAIQAYRKVTHLQNDNYEAWYNMGLAYAVWGEYEDAIKCYQRAIDIQPEHIDALGNIASAYQHTNHFDEAIAMCKNALAIKQDEIWILDCLALSYLLAQQTEQAFTEYERILSIAQNKEELRPVIFHLRSAASKNPDIPGMQDALDRLETATVPQPGYSSNETPYDTIEEM